jgi:hypothetical protein
MKSFEELHQAAMEAYYKAYFGKRRQELDESTIQMYFQEAFGFEKEAVMSILHNPDYDKLRAVYCRSAANLAYEVGAYTDVEFFVAHGLLNSPSEEVQTDLRQLYLQTLKALKKQATATKKTTAKSTKPRKKVNKKKQSLVLEK